MYTNLFTVSPLLTEHKLSRGQNFLASMKKWGCYYQDVDYLIRQTDIQPVSQQSPASGQYKRIRMDHDCVPHKEVVERGVKMFYQTLPF